MCTIILKVVFLAALAAGVGLTIVALTTSYWRTYNDGAHHGVYKFCTKASCTDLWTNIPTWRKAVLACLFVTLGISIFAFGWWLITCVGCCCQGCLAPPLPIVAIIMTMIQMAAVITFAVMFKWEDGDKSLPASRYGYSFWCAVGSIFCFALAVVIGCALTGMLQNGKRRSAYREI